MSVTLPDNDEVREIYYQIHGFFEHLSDNEGFNTLKELYNRGVTKRVADDYLFNLLPRKNKFTTDEIDKLKIQVGIINANRYPQELKDAMSKLLSILTKIRRNAGNNVSRGAEGGNRSRKRRKAKKTRRN